MNVFKSSNIIILGRETEHHVCTVKFPIADWIEKFGAGGTFHLYNKRNGDTEAYPVVTTSDSEYVYWTLNETDLAYKGFGEAQLDYAFGTHGEPGYRKACSEIFETQVGRSIISGEEIPEPYLPWISHIEGYADRAERAKTEAEAFSSSAERAKTEAEAFSSSAERAKTEAEAFSSSAERAKTEAEAFSSSAERAKTEAEAFSSSAERAKTEAEAFSSSAELSASNAEEFAENAEKFANDAAGIMGLAVFEINTVDGNLYITFPTPYYGAEFSLNENGFLEVITDG